MTLDQIFKRIKTFEPRKVIEPIEVLRTIKPKKERKRRVNTIKPFDPAKK